jgi:hypothetical protein
MSAIPKAAYLSFASEDAAAVSQLTEALRTAGVEVWFDQSELRDGDAWDRKIKKQVKECALFVPVISSNTQARKEGPFRSEWRHAEQRTHELGKSAAYIVPVCFDGVRDEEADVPNAFMEVQWTRMRRLPEVGGLDPLELGDFAQQVKNLIACRNLQFTPAPFGMSGPAQPPTTPPPGSMIAPVRMTVQPPGPAVTPEPTKPGVPTAVWVAVAVVVSAALIYFAFLR